MVSANVNSIASKFKFGGKEFNDELGLDWYDFGARNYDASLGRWMNLDPLAENYYYDTPYAYTTNNPVLFVDVDGKYWKKGENGTWIAQKGDSASTLARDAGISFEKAKIIMANTEKDNILGNMGTYIDPKDGIEKSAVDPGDVVYVLDTDTKVQEELAAHNNNVVSELNEEIAVNEATKADKMHESDSLNGVKKRINDELSLQIEAGVYDGEAWDNNGKTMKVAQLIQVAIVTKKSIKIDKKVKKNQKTVDSLDKQNDLKRREINQRGHIPNSSNIKN